MKLKFSIYIVSSIAIVACFTFSSCEKEFLDKTPYDAVPFDEALATEEDLAAAMNGVYSAMRSPALYGRTLPIMGDLLADNVYIFQVNSGRYLPFYNYAIFDDNGDVAGLWASAYNCILLSNQIINADVASNETVDQLKGEAYTARAMLYFDLVRAFAVPYSTENLNLPGVPVVLNYDPTLKPARNTIGEVYAQIENDLLAASSLMTIDKRSEEISMWVAKGLLAKVYQFMGDWENAKLYAEDLVLNSGYALTDSSGYVAYWADPGETNKSETLFELLLDAVESNGYESLASMYADAGYGDAMCDSNLYNSYSDFDVRKLLMYTDMRNGEEVVYVNKYSNMTNQADKDDVKILRLSEVYLILAEAYYRLGDEGNARVYLNTIAQIREPQFAGYVSSGDALLDDIINERRKELAFEGNRFFDLNRLGRNIERGAQFPVEASFIAADDYRRIMPIPLSEMNANGNMTQNPGY